MVRSVAHAGLIHPGCGTGADDLNDEDPFAAMLKAELVRIVKWFADNAPRSQQKTIGPSEMGSPCDRRIGYRLAQVPEVNIDFDPWPSSVGTAVHSWLQGAFDSWVRQGNGGDWMTEQTLRINEFVTGHSDLYWPAHATVIDWKTAGPDAFRKTQLHGPDPGYIVQAHIYGYGFASAGFRVERVALVYLPRAGWLKDMYPWVADYDERIAVDAIRRMYQIAQQVVNLNALKESHRWEQVPATPSNACGFCPWFNAGKSAETGADSTGCPGR